jgi:hypothetical protein
LNLLYAAKIGSNPITALLVAVILFGLGRMVIRRMAFAEGNQWLVPVMTISLLLHLLAAPSQIFVTDHFYHGIADWVRYTHQGVLLAPNFRHFDFTTAGANVRQIVNDGSVSIATGIVMTIVGANDAATFLVFSWLSFIGSVFFYRAFTLTFPGANHRRYAILLFFFPSLIFWTADASKEAIMTFALGLAAYGCAKILARRPGGFTLLVPGAAIGVLIRPNEMVLVLAGFVVAMMVPTASARKNMGGIRRVLGFIFCAVLLIAAFGLTQHYLVHSGGSVSGQLQATSANNSQVSSGGIPYSSSPATFPRDVYEIMFNPLPINAHGFGELVAATENSIIIVLILMSLREIRILPRAAFARPYVMLCIVYWGGFMYVFAALGNLGLIERERTMLIPFLLVLFCVPRTPKRTPPDQQYDWELRRRGRLLRRQQIESNRFGRPRPGVPRVPTAGQPTAQRMRRPPAGPAGTGAVG